MPGTVVIPSSDLETEDASVSRSITDNHWGLSHLGFRV